MPSNVAGARFVKALSTVSAGSVVIVCTPALDGYEDIDQAYPHKDGASHGDARLRHFYACVSINSEAGHVVPRPVVPASCADGIPAPYRVYYSHSDDGTTLQYQAQARVYHGLQPSSRVVFSVWKGKVKMGLMIPAEYSAALVAALAADGYR